MHKNSGTSCNSSSPSCTPLFEHMLTHATLGHGTTNTSTRLCSSSHEKARTSTWTCATHTLHHKTGKQSTLNGSHGQGHGQAPQLQTANEQPEIQNSMEPVSSQQIQATGKWHWRAHQKTPPTLSRSSPNTKYRQTAGKTSHTGSSYAWSDPKRQNPTECDSR